MRKRRGLYIRAKTNFLDFKILKSRQFEEINNLIMNHYWKAISALYQMILIKFNLSKYTYDKNKTKLLDLAIKFLD